MGRYGSGPHELSVYLSVAVEVQGDDGTWRGVPTRPIPCAWCNGTGVEAPREAAAGRDEPQPTRGGAAHPEPIARRCWYCRGSRCVYPSHFEDTNYHGYPVLHSAAERGLPPDLPAEIRQAMADGQARIPRSPADPRSCFYVGQRAHGWPTLEELIAYDWDGDVYDESRFVTLEAFRRWLETGRPGEAPQERLAEHEIYLPPEAARWHLWSGSILTPPPGRAYVTRVPVPNTSVRDHARAFRQWVQSELWAMGAPHRVRIVVGLHRAPDRPAPNDQPPAGRADRERAADEGVVRRVHISPHFTLRAIGALVDGPPARPAPHPAPDRATPAWRWPGSACRRAQPRSSGCAGRSGRRRWRRR